MAEHAKLSPSAAERWLSCPASVLMSEHIPDQPSSYAEEGTTAHELAYIRGRYVFGSATSEEYEHEMEQWRAGAERTYSPEQVRDMEVHTDAWLDLLREHGADRPDVAALFEQRLQTGIERCWGTTDAALVSPDTIKVLDFKYGAGVPVSAVDNPQLKLYALGALDTYGDLIGDTELVQLIIHQPRLDSVSIFDMTPDELRDWREEIRPRAAEALAPGAPFGPSYDACRWCPARGQCRAQLDAAVADDFGPVELLDPDEIADALRRVKFIKDWLGALEEVALHKAYSEGVHLPGWKVVASGGQRRVSNADLARDRLVEQLGLDPADFTETKMVGITKLEKLIKSAGSTVEDALGDAVERTPGRPSLVHEEDKRPPLNPEAGAAADFEDLEEDQ